MKPWVRIDEIDGGCMAYLEYGGNEHCFSRLQNRQARLFSAWIMDASLVVVARMVFDAELRTTVVPDFHATHEWAPYKKHRDGSPYCSVGLHEPNLEDIVMLFMSQVGYAK